jgi:uncharacterized Rossmann fold enzyme
VSLQHGHALASSHVPDPAGFVDGGRAAHVASELELCAGDLAGVALEHMNWFS